MHPDVPCWKTMETPKCFAFICGPFLTITPYQPVSKRCAIFDLIWAPRPGPTFHDATWDPDLGRVNKSRLVFEWGLRAQGLPDRTGAEPSTQHAGINHLTASLEADWPAIKHHYNIRRDESGLSWLRTSAMLLSPSESGSPTTPSFHELRHPAISKSNIKVLRFSWGLHKGVKVTNPPFGFGLTEFQMVLLWLCEL